MKLVTNGIDHKVTADFKQIDHCLPRMAPAWLLTSKVLRSGQGGFPPNLVAIRHSWANWLQIDHIWPLHDFWPQQSITLWSEILPAKFGGHRAFLSKFIDPGWDMHDLWPQQSITLWSGVLPTKFGGHRVFLGKLTSGWPWMTPAWLLTPAKYYALVRGSSYQIW